MSREVRKVPANWIHPVDANGDFVPLYDGKNYLRHLADWDFEEKKWNEGLRSDFKGGFVPRNGDELSCPYVDWNGERPDHRDYMPIWTEDQCTHLMMYEDTTEGTPLSPAFKTPEELAQWLSDNRASACGPETATYKQWLSMIESSGFAPSGIIANDKFINGVSAVAEIDSANKGNQK